MKFFKHILLLVVFTFLLTSCTKPKVEETYLITFETFGGTVIEKGSIKPEDPEKVGFSFMGWFKDRDYEIPYSFGVLTEDITVYAKWEANNYEIHFNANGGSQVDSISLHYEALIPELPTPTRENFVFVGWFIDESLKEAFKETNMPSSNINLYAKWEEDSMDFSYTLTEDGYVVVGYDGDDKDIIIPSTFNNKAVISIGDGAFMDKRIESIIIPEGVKIIGTKAFYGSTLKKITIEGNTLTHIQDDAFNGTKITSINIPSSVIHIGNRAFYEVESLIDINIPESSRLEHIGEYAFLNTRFDAFYIPETVKTIGQYAFYFNTRLHVYTKLSKAVDTWAPTWNPNRRPVYYGFTEEEWLLNTLSEIPIPKEVITDIGIPKTLNHNGKAYEITWVSSSDALTVDGKVLRYLVDKSVTLEATIDTNKIVANHIFEVIVMKKEAVNPFIKEHQFLAYSKDLDPELFHNVRLVGDYLELVDEEDTGYYESEIYRISSVSKLVASWGAITSTTSTVELQVRVMVGGNWSKYFSYQKWGFGLNNKSVNDSDNIAKLSIDELMILNGLKATRIQYKVLLYRTGNESPKLKHVAMALTMDGYTYKPDISTLPKVKDYDVPKLNQQAVPTIGNSICSPTSSAMLLMYKGHDFSAFDEYPHRYTAEKFKDYGANIFGNWVFNTVGMSQYETSYVGKMYGYEELFHHLNEIGPVAASVRGDMGLYNTGGHLLVVRGYRILDDGKIYVITNDPNIDARFGNDSNGNPLFVYYEFPLEVFMRTWNGMVYILE